MSRDLRNIDLNLLVIFNTLADEEHLTKTAQKLHLSQPAVSNALARLRELFADDLFVRSPKGMRPTAKAKALKQPVRQALEIIQTQLMPPDVFDCATAKDRFAISVNGYAEFVIIPLLIKAFRQQAPSITLEVFPESDAQTPERLRSGELDLAIDYLSIPGKDLVEDYLLDEEMVVVASKGHPQLQGGISLSLYNQLPHVAILPRNHRGSHTEILLGRKQIKRNVILSVSNLISLPPIVANSDLICTLPKRLAEHFVQHLPIAIYPLPFDLDRVPVYMIYHRDQHNNEAHRWLRSQIQTLVQAAQAQQTAT